MKPTIVLDMDGVVACFVRRFTALMLSVQGKDTRDAYGTGAQLHWDFENHGFSKDVINKAWDSVRASETFWTTLPTLLTTEERDEIRGLARDFTVKFVTSRVGLNVLQQTERWLSDRGLLVGTVIVAEDKVDIIKRFQPLAVIDDKPEVIEALLEYGVMCYIRDFPYNRHVAGPRVSSMTEFVARVYALALTPA